VPARLPAPKTQEADTITIIAHACAVMRRRQA